VCIITSARVKSLLQNYSEASRSQLLISDCHTSRIGRSAEVQCNFFLACSQTYSVLQFILQLHISKIFKKARLSWVLVRISHLTSDNLSHQPIVLLRTPVTVLSTTLIMLQLSVPPLCLWFCSFYVVCKDMYWHTFGLSFSKLDQPRSGEILPSVVSVGQPIFPYTALATGLCAICSSICSCSRRV